ncbi:hypothetical protein AOLI_G00168900 [Acnodon oligacanthus]
MPGHCASTGSAVELLVFVRVSDCPLLDRGEVVEELKHSGCLVLITTAVDNSDLPCLLKHEWEVESLSVSMCGHEHICVRRPVTSGGTIATPASVTHFHSHRPNLSFPMATAEPAPAWWKLTFLRKKKSEPKVMYEIPAEYINAEATPGTAGPPDDSQFNARLERIVDKTATKGRHVKVSHSGRFKEKKRIRATLSENPELFPNSEPCNGNESTNK